jgi:hypothetical protein
MVPRCTPAVTGRRIRHRRRSVSLSLRCCSDATPAAKGTGAMLRRRRRQRKDGGHTGGPCVKAVDAQGQLPASAPLPPPRNPHPPRRRHNVPPAKSRRGRPALDCDKGAAAACRSFAASQLCAVVFALRPLRPAAVWEFRPSNLGGSNLAKPGRARRAPLCLTSRPMARLEPRPDVRLLGVAGVAGGG